MNKIKSNVLDQNLCISCGVCNHKLSSKFKFNEFGYLLPTDAQNLDDKVCPMNDLSFNEDEICERKFSNKLTKTEIGYFDSIFAAYRSNTSELYSRSSGGIITFLLKRLLEDKLVDAVVTVFPSDTKPYFKYELCNDPDRLQYAATSAYYPVEISSALNLAEKKGLKVAITGLPCTVKALNNLKITNSNYNELITYTISLICGHLKTSNYLELLSKQLPHVNNPSYDFRKRTSTVKAKEKVFSKSSHDQVVSRKTSSLYGGTYNYGYFQYEGCNYCDDIIGETADFSVGDAWLPEYVDTEHGVSLCISRNSTLTNLIKRNEITIIKLNSKDVINAQAGGYRQRREGLAYRLNKFPVRGLEKRTYLFTDRISAKRKKLYNARYELSKASNLNYLKVIKKEITFKGFQSLMLPYLNAVQELQKETFMSRVWQKFKREIRKIAKKV